MAQKKRKLQLVTEWTALLFFVLYFCFRFVLAPK